jgi:hypothetical protein
MSEASRTTDSKRHRRGRTRGASAVLLFAISGMASGCRLGTAPLPSDDLDLAQGAGPSTGAAPDGMGSTSSSTEAGTSGTDAGTGGASSATGGAGAAPALHDSGAGGASGAAGVSGDGAIADAGMQQPAGDAGDDAREPVDPVTCAFDYSLCLLFDPLNYDGCTQMSAEQCDLFGTPGGTSSDAGTEPSEACVLEEAACIMNDPADFAACEDMLATCTL